MPATLYLLPNRIAETEFDVVLPAQALAVLKRTRRFLAENARSARRFLSAAGHPEAIDTLEVIEIGHAPDASLYDAWLAPLLSDNTLHTAVVSESGCPAVADPGAGLVRRAHELGIPVKPLVGPSSLLLTLMASGMNGQRFRFLGYLPIDREKRATALRQLEAESSRSTETELFIETPYRNNQMLAAMTQTLHPDTLITVATDVTGSEESIVTKTAAQWKKTLPELPKLPTVFSVLGAKGCATKPIHTGGANRAAEHRSTHRKPDTPRKRRA